MCVSEREVEIEMKLKFKNCKLWKIQFEFSFEFRALGFVKTRSRARVNTGEWSEMITKRNDQKRGDSKTSIRNGTHTELLQSIEQDHRVSSSILWGRESVYEAKLLPNLFNQADFSLFTGFFTTIFTIFDHIGVQTVCAQAPNSTRRHSLRPSPSFFLESAGRETVLAGYQSRPELSTRTRY